MKLNFWQILGLLLLVAAGIVFVYERNKGPAAPTATPTSAPSGALPRPVE